MDLGTDSILKPCCRERDLQIGAPEPSQLALDRALDSDLLRFRIRRRSCARMMPSEAVAPCAGVHRCLIDQHAFFQVTTRRAFSAALGS